MSDAWMDNIEAETQTKPSPKTSTTMTVKKTSALATRSLDSFKLFQDKKFVSGYQNLVTIQPLNKSKTRGWFVRKSDLDTCGWTATEEQFAKGSVIWNYKQTFGMAPNTSVEEGLNFTEPRLQVLLRSPLMVEETTGMRQTIGTFEDPEVKELFEADKIASDLANSKGEMYKRKYSVRTKYLVYILTENNKRAHKIPMVLTLKGLNGTDVSEKIKMYEKEMSKCLSKALDSEVPLSFNEKFYATTVFAPVLANEMRGANNVEICAIESFDIPDYSSQDAAIESLNRLSIPDEDRESTWKFQDMFSDYINQHSRQDAEKLGGAYGIKEGIEILPVSRTTDVEVKALPARDPMTGEDDSLL
ncbi:MAG: hypothetical protein EBZ61_08515 [Micrococcales bacterium]|nr:hypothetical protein [Micrococcales bacterium]